MIDRNSFMKSNVDKAISALENEQAKIKDAVSSVKNKLTDSGSAGAPLKPNITGAQIGLPDSLRGNNNYSPGDERFFHSETANPAPNDKEIVDISFTPNILDNYDVVTYNWKLYITDLTSANTGNFLKPSNQSIVAQTGVTDFTIEKIEIDGITTPTVMTGTGTQTTTKFQIVEPSGAGLLDKLYYESIALGLGNWLVMPCYLELTFKAREPSTSESPQSGTTSELNNLRWVWPIKLTDCKAQVTHVGTRYDFEAIVYDELAQSNAYFGIQHNITLTNLEGPLKQAMDQLEKKLNDDQLTKLAGNYLKPDRYKFVIDPVLLDGVKMTVDKKNENSSRWSDFLNFDSKQASFNSGTGVDKIIDLLLGNSDYYQKRMQSSNARDSTPNPAPESEPMRKFWRVITETRPYAFDELRQDNAVDITVFIVEYDLGLADVYGPQTAQTVQSSSYAKKRLNEYIKKKILRKRYDYIFTGLNDQIISFDLNLNFSFAAALARFDGLFYDSTTRDTGVVAPVSVEAEIEANKQLNSIVKFRATVPDQDRENFDAQIRAGFRQQAEYIRQTESTQTGRINALNRISNTYDTIVSGNIDLIVNRAKEEARKANSLTAIRENDRNFRFVSDVDINSEFVKQSEAEAKALSKGKLRGIPYREASQENNLGYGAEPSSDAARARTANVFSTALYSSLDASLQTIRITIKGDPFWIFPQPIPANKEVYPYKALMPPNEAIKLIKNSQVDFPNTANLFGTDNFIIVRLRTPQVANNDTGTVDRNDSNIEVETFSGVYKVVTIKSKFENGKFVQELFCILDPVIDLKNFIQEIEASSGRIRSLPEDGNSLSLPDVQVTQNPIRGFEQVSLRRIDNQLLENQSNIPGDISNAERILRSQTPFSNRG